MVNFVRYGAKAFAVVTLLTLSHSAETATVGFRAYIGSNTEGCSVIAPERTLNFSALKARDLIGEVTTHEILPLHFSLFCQDADVQVTPSLTVTGTTPYAGTAGNVFLDGAVNGVGFMVRRSDGSTPSLVDFYNNDAAVVNNGDPIEMAPLDSSNNYYSEETFLVGLVGPLSSSVVPGTFSATLVVNVFFQ